MHILQKALSRIIAVMLIVWAFALPAFAQQTPNGLQNPLKFEGIQNFVEGVLKAIVMIALPLITIFIVWAGFLFISARGKSGQLTEAKKNFQYVIIGTILILSAWVLATLIGGTVTQLLR